MNQAEIEEAYTLFQIPIKVMPRNMPPIEFAASFKKCGIKKDVAIKYSGSTGI